MTAIANSVDFFRRYTGVAVQGTIVITADAGRALRKQRAAVLVVDVLWCSGDLCPGDQVHVVVRGADGGQGVIATGIIRCSAGELKKGVEAAVAASGTRSAIVNLVVVIAEQDLTMLWPARPRDRA
jgi:glutamate 5-kinase